MTRNIAIEVIYPTAMKLNVRIDYTDSMGGSATIALPTGGRVGLSRECLVRAAREILDMFGEFDRTGLRHEENH